MKDRGSSNPFKFVEILATMDDFQQVIPDKDKFLMKVILYGNDPERVDGIIKMYRLQPKIMHLKKMVQKGKTYCLSVVLKYFNGLKDSFPDICIQLIRGELLSNRIKIPSFHLLRELVMDYKIDVNYVDIKQGTMLHTLCYFPSQQHQVNDFIESLMEERDCHGKQVIAIDIDRMSRKRRRTRDHFFQSTPLQFAIEKGCYEYACFLIKKGARTDNLVFDKYSVRNDLRRQEKKSYLNLMKLLITIGSLDVKTLTENVKLNQNERRLVMDCCIKRSLLDMSLNVIRRIHPTRSSLESFIDALEEQICIDPRIRANLLMKNI